jgi:hypothetical protein
MTQVPPAVITHLSGWQIALARRPPLGPIPNMTNIIYLSLVIISLSFPLFLFHSYYFSIFRKLHRQLQCCRLITQRTNLSSLAHIFLPYAR